jgi:hypothetical protein
METALVPFPVRHTLPIIYFIFKKIHFLAKKKIIYENLAINM